MRYYCLGLGYYTVPPPEKLEAEKAANARLAYFQFLDHCSKRKKNPFVDRVELQLTPGGFRISYSHWTKRRQNVSLDWGNIKSITAVQREPMLLTMRLEMKAGSIHEVDEEMQGWGDFLSELQKQFEAFDWSMLEEAKGAIDKPFVCWRGNR